MSEPFLGEIRLWSGNICPRHWAFCQGQLLAINANAALFSILGTVYGGNGVTNFGLPNLTDRVPVQWDRGLGLSLVSIGEVGGSDHTTLLSTHLPAHNHLVAAVSASPDSGDPSGHLPAAPGRRTPIYSSGSPTTVMSAAALSPAGNNLPVPTRPPFLVINYIIALQGIFPTRG